MLISLAWELKLEPTSRMDLIISQTAEIMQNNRRGVANQRNSCVVNGNGLTRPMFKSSFEKQH